MANAEFRVVVENVLEQARASWRHRWVALAVAWSVAVILWIVIFLFPDKYEATARVFVDTKTTLSQATHGISLGDDMDSQIQRVRQALLGGPQLQKVAQDTDLMAGALTERAQSEVLDELRKAIEIKGGMDLKGAIPAPRDAAQAAAQAAGVYTITYQNPVRAKALQVVDRLLNTFVEGTLGSKRLGSEQAQQFLTGQIADYERRLSAQEDKLAQFKKQNVGLMPREQGDYFTKLQAEMDDLSKARESLAVAVRKRDELAKQLHGEQPFGAPSGSAARTGGSATGAGSTLEPADTATRIRETQARIDELLLRFTEKHPDVIALRQTLKDLQARQQEEIAAVRRGDPGAADRAGLTSSPVYQSIQLQYDQADVDVAALDQDIADRERNIAQLRTMASTAPEVEAEFSKLARDYDVTKAEYHALVERLDEAKLGQDADATGLVKFEVIDPPTADFKPVSPNRPLLVSAALILGLLAGAGAAYAMHLLQPVFISARQLQLLTGRPVIGAVSRIWLAKYRGTRKRNTLLYAGGTAGLVLVALGILVLQQTITDVVRRLFA
jgi:polysaccharide chain length determinant protein (PEP-CTERM system associated)